MEAPPQPKDDKVGSGTTEDSNKRKREDECIEIDPKGDLWAHFQNVKVLVSHKILSLGSPVFEAMLGGNFRESIKNNSPPDGKNEITLPEDDPIPFVLFSRILHHRQDEISSAPDSSALLALATFCDKYQCYTIMKPHFEKWIMENLYPCVKVVESKRYAELLVVSYICDIPHLFKLISEGTLWILRRWSKNVQFRQSWYDSLSHTLVRQNLGSELETRRVTVDRDIHDAMMTPFEHIKNSTCPNAKGHAGAAMEAIYGAKLLPNDVAEKSVPNILSEARNLFVSYHTGNTCPITEFTLGSVINEAVKKLTAQGLGLCLDCVKTRGKSATEKKCRVTHETKFGDITGIYLYIAQSKTGFLIPWNT